MPTMSLEQKDNRTKIGKKSPTLAEISAYFGGNDMSMYSSLLNQISTTQQLPERLAPSFLLNHDIRNDKAFNTKILRQCNTGSIELFSEIALRDGGDKDGLTECLEQINENYIDATEYDVLKMFFGGQCNEEPTAHEVRVSDFTLSAIQCDFRKDFNGCVYALNNSGDEDYVHIADYLIMNKKIGNLFYVDADKWLLLDKYIDLVGVVTFMKGVSALRGDKNHDLTHIFNEADQKEFADYCKDNREVAMQIIAQSSMKAITQGDSKGRILKRYQNLNPNYTETDVGLALFAPTETLTESFWLATAVVIAEILSSYVASAYSPVIKEGLADVNF